MLRCARPRGIPIPWNTWLQGPGPLWFLGGSPDRSDLVGVTLEPCPSLLFVVLVVFFLFLFKILYFFQVAKARAGNLNKSTNEFDRLHFRHSSETSQTVSLEGLH